MKRRPRVILLFALVACGGGETGVESEAMSPVEIVTAVEEPFAITIDAMAVVSSRPEGVAELKAPGVSRVTSIRVGIGDVVSAGQLMVQLDPSVWAAQLAEADAAVAAASQAAERAKRLADDGILPRKEAEQAASALASAQAARAGAARTRSLADVRSPMRGVVDSLDAALDELVAAGDVIVRVVDPRAIELVFHLPPEEAARVAVDMPVRAGPRGGSRGAAAWSADGRVAAVGASIDAASGGVRVRATITQTSRPLRIGEFVDGRIEVDRHDRAIVVPAAAIVETSGDEATLFTVGDDGLAHARTVTIGGRSGDRVEVVRGLEAGESVVGQGAYGVADSARVRGVGT